jgi:flagellar L-ring protein precursor FlgH
MNILKPFCDVQISLNRYKFLNMLKQIMREILTTSTMNNSASTKHVQKFNARYLFSAHHFFILMLIGLVSLSGCTVVPTSVVQQPMTAKAKPIAPPKVSSGSIYNNGSYRAMFEDRKPRQVGDIVTINIQENTSATKSGGSSGSKNGAIDTSVTAIFGAAFPSATTDVSGSSSYGDKADANSSNVFSGAITTTVIEVLPNGYFLVSGEKQVSLDKGTEFVRFSGVVNPDNITIGNFVSSTFVADARVEYRTASKIDAAEIGNVISRFFLSVSGL